MLAVGVGERNIDLAGLYVDTRFAIEGFRAIVENLPFKFLHGGIVTIQIQPHTDAIISIVRLLDGGVFDDGGFKQGAVGQCGGGAEGEGTCEKDFSVEVGKVLNKRGKSKDEDEYE